MFATSIIIAAITAATLSFLCNMCQSNSLNAACDNQCSSVQCSKHVFTVTIFYWTNISEKQWGALAIFTDPLILLPGKRLDGRPWRRRNPALSFFDFFNSLLPLHVSRSYTLCLKVFSSSVTQRPMTLEVSIEWNFFFYFLWICIIVFQFFGSSCW